MKALRKVLVSVSGIALLAMETLMYVPAVSAASSTVVTTGSTTTSVAVTFGTVFAAWQKVTISVKRLNGTNAGIDISSIAADVTVGGVAVDSVDVNNADSITVTVWAGATDGTIAIANAVLPDNENYSVSVSTDAGGYGEGQLTLGAPTSNVVNVSASVIPTLSMTLTNQTINFGTLIQWTTATAASGTVIAVATNAANGYTVKVASANWSLAGTATPITSATADLSVAAKWYWIQAASTAWAPSLDAAYNLAASNVWQLQTTAQDLFTKNALTTNDQVTVTYKAKIDNTIVAGNYADTLTYTITWNF